MMFDKNNTNFKGECLCKSCKHGKAVYIGTGNDRHQADTTFFCLRYLEECMNVGVCKDYDEFKRE